MKVSSSLLFFLIIPFFLSCCYKPELVTYAESVEQNQTPTQPLLTSLANLENSLSEVRNKIDLWTRATPMLRGANIWQAVVIPAVDGTFKGSGSVGPPFTQEDFDLLASLGANYVVISAPGLFTENPPYQVDEEVQRNLDRMLEMIEKADMFATIAFRTGPGKAEWSLCCSDTHDYDGYFNDAVWSDPQAQAAWVAMWQYTAERYHGNRMVVGYELMVEPNAADILYGIDSPKEFFRSYSGTIADWSTLYPQIVNAIREVDEKTPVLIGADGYSSIAWLSYLIPAASINIVYDVHQYMPYDTYTHQNEDGKNRYPGTFDVDYDGKEEAFDKNYLSSLLQPVRQYVQKHKVPVAINEFGVKRWVPGAANYLYDLLSLFEQEGWNYAIWEWSTSYEPYGLNVDDFNYKLGIDPLNKSTLLENSILTVLRNYWSLNIIRPSNAPW